MSRINGNLVKQRRQQLGLSQIDLAEKLGVSKVSISWYETGERKPCFDNFIKLAEILDLSLEQLAGIEASIVSEEDNNYTIKLPKQDIVIINEFKKYPKIYNLLYNDPVRTIKLIEKKLK